MHWKENLKNNQACRDSSPELCDTGAAPALKPIELASKLGAGHWFVRKDEDGMMNI